MDNTGEIKFKVQVSVKKSCIFVNLASHKRTLQVKQNTFSLLFFYFGFVIFPGPSLFGGSSRLRRFTNFGETTKLENI